MNQLWASLNSVGIAITTLLLSPASNMRAAILLYAMIGVLLLIVLVVGLMLILGSPESRPPVAGPLTESTPAHAQRQARPPMSTRARVLSGVGVVVLLTGVWIAAGASTSDSALCRSCHETTTEHAKPAKGANPHAAVDCVACHEGGGYVRRYVTGLPSRVLHLAAASSSVSTDTGYGKVTTDACASCHRPALVGSKTNEARGLKISHAEPLAASANCTDCHVMRNGAASVYNAGMKPCLRCHDGSRASSACPTCHVENAATAARARTTSFQNDQIRDITCGGCHDEKRSCDPCHGLRMPHTSAFMAGGHARAAAVDFWFNDGKECARCHTQQRRPCTRCHTSLIGKAHGTTGSLAVGHQKASEAGCNGCHLQFAHIASRDFCKDLCHTPAAVASSPR